MPILTFNDIEESSQDAAKKNFGMESTINLDDHKGNFKAKDNSFVILGHTSETTFDYIITSKTQKTLGGLTAKEMAKKLASGVPKNERGGIEHIYLVACEAGFKDSPNNPSYARDLAAALYNEGFKNINVHAFHRCSVISAGEQSILTESYIILLHV